MKKLAACDFEDLLQVGTFILLRMATDRLP
jgi:hypothetical protein